MSWWWDEKNLWILASFLEARLKVSNLDLGSRKWPCLELPGFGRTRPRPRYTADLATQGTCRSQQHCHGVWYAPAWPPFPSFNCPQCPLCHLSPLYSHARPLNPHSGVKFVGGKQNPTAELCTLCLAAAGSLEDSLIAFIVPINLNC